jgi:hypothetical protein
MKQIEFVQFISFSTAAHTIVSGSAINLPGKMRHSLGTTVAAAAVTTTTMMMIFAKDGDRTTVLPWFRPTLGKLCCIPLSGSPSIHTLS